jgi:hypothetical protein
MMTEQHPPLLDDLHSQRLYLRAPRHNDGNLRDTCVFARLCGE